MSILDQAEQAAHRVDTAYAYQQRWSALMDAINDVLDPRGMFLGGDALGTPRDADARFRLINDLQTSPGAKGCLWKRNTFDHLVRSVQVHELAHEMGIPGWEDFVPRTPPPPLPPLPFPASSSPEPWDR